MNSTLAKERQRLKDSFFIPLVFVGILWFIKIAELIFSVSFGHLGIYPRDLERIWAVFTAPLIHGSLDHLFSNSVPIIVLGFLIFHIYNKISYKLIVLLYILSGLGTWLIGRTSFHIGASGVVYGLAFFLFFSGVFRRDVKSMALALLVAFLYGGIVWGLLPIREGVSFEGHIAGALAGIGSAYYYRKVNAPKPHQWDEPEEDVENIVEEPFWQPQRQTIPIDDEPPKNSDDILNWDIKYHYVEKKK